MRAVRGSGYVSVIAGTRTQPRILSLYAGAFHTKLAGYGLAARTPVATQAPLSCSVPPEQHCLVCRALVDTWHQLQARRAQEASGRVQELAQLDVQIEQATAKEQEMAAQLAAAQKQAVKGARIGPHAASRQV